MNIHILMLIIFQTALCVSQAYASGGSYKIPIQSICELKEWNDDMNGRILRIKANYDTDYMHYDSLSDEACKNFTVGLHLDSEIDRSVDVFMEKFRKMTLRNKNKRVWIDMVALFYLRPGYVINKNSPKYKQLEIGPRGFLTAIKILDFGEINSKKPNKQASRLN